MVPPVGHDPTQPRLKGGRSAHLSYDGMAPPVRFELTSPPLTAVCSTLIELRRNRLAGPLRLARRLAGSEPARHALDHRPRDGRETRIRTGTMRSQSAHAGSVKHHLPNEWGDRTVTLRLLGGHNSALLLLSYGHRFPHTSCCRPGPSRWYAHPSPLPGEQSRVRESLTIEKLVVRLGAAPSGPLLVRLRRELSRGLDWLRGPTSHRLRVAL